MSSARSSRFATSSDQSTRSNFDTLDLQLVLPERVRAGEPMVITLRVRNPGHHAIDVYMRGRSPTFDVIVSREDGATVWHRLQNEIIPAIALVRTLAPSEQFEISAEWDGRDSSGKPLVAGNYSARAMLFVEGPPLPAPPVTFTLER